MRSYVLFVRLMYVKRYPNQNREKTKRYDEKSSLSGKRYYLTSRRRVFLLYALITVETATTYEYIALYLCRVIGRSRFERISRNFFGKLSRAGSNKYVYNVKDTLEQIESNRHGSNRCRWKQWVGKDNLSQ